VTALLVAVFGGLGSLARYGVSGIVQRSGRSSFPAGTLVVNLTGAFLGGALAGLAYGHAVNEMVLAAAGAGFLGGYTTFSTWMVETVLAAEAGGRSGTRRATVNLAAHLAGGLALVVVGFAAGSSL